MQKQEDYVRFFALIFPVAIIASFAQIFEIVMQESFSSFLGAKELLEEEIKDDEALRAFYNPNIILMAFFGALFFLTRKDIKFNKVYLNILAVSAFSMAFLSATRGWIIGFGISLILFMVLVTGFKLMRMISFGVVSISLFFLVMQIPVMNTQIVNAYDRFLTLEQITEGDITAGETQIRTTVRGPRVMGKWQESPILGFGFSNAYREYGDVHVGNQNILLQSGIIGFTLMMSFLLYFMATLYRASLKNYDKSLRVFVVFFLGWFFIHSTSGQHFAYGYLIGHIITQIVFFSFGAVCLADSENKLLQNQV